MGKCTAPSWFGFQKWFDSRFESLCIEHDNEYIRCCPYLKFRSDIVMTVKMWKRGYPLMAILALIYNVSLGTIYWIYRRALDFIKLIKRVI